VADKDLKLLFMDANDLQDGVKTHTQASKINGEYEKLIDQIRIILRLAEFHDDGVDQLSSADMRVVNDMIGAAYTGKIEFGAEWMPALIDKIGPIKNELQVYVNELRQLAMQI
jgi:hypothetical protein